MRCASCHATSFTTGETDVAALSNLTIAPYTDLLLHDMGPELADGRPHFEATGTEWRTQPLWGLGLIEDDSLIEDVNGARFLLHDGRARTIEEAILWHGGKAEAAREAFRNADARHTLLQRNALDRSARWETRDELRIEIITSSERTYHRRRRQTALGRLTPIEYEVIMTPQTATAA